MAEGVRFELTRPFGLPVFKTGAINRSATPPEIDRAPHAPVARKEQLDSSRSHFFPIGTVPAEKCFQSLDIGLVKINKIFSFVTGDFARIRRRTGFYTVYILYRIEAEKSADFVQGYLRIAPEIFKLDDLDLFPGKISEHAFELLRVKASIYVGKFA